MRLKASLLAATMLTLAGAAQAGELRGTYFAFEGGASWVGNERFFQDIIFTTGATTHSEFRSEYDTGWSVFGSVGYGFDNNVRLELEAGYRRNDVDRLLTTLGSPLSPTGELGEFTLMANILYDFRLGKKLTASIGAGVGADHAHLELATLNLDENDWVFAYQALAGLNYAIGDGTQLFLNYRYLHADAPDYSVNLGGVPGVTQNVSFHGDLEKHAVTLGFRFALHGEATPPPPPAPPQLPSPPPPPPAPVVPRQFIIFFGFDQYNLTSEAQRVIEDSVEAAKETGAVALIIIGHTDSSGSAGYNQELSTRRANAVRGALERLGVPASKISASGKGETELTVRTDDGVKEPQNRRATIDLQ